ncbi:MAG TPA: 3'-5' exonuclease [Thermodesulfobacteriota bacterium]
MMRPWIARIWPFGGGGGSPPGPLPAGRFCALDIETTGLDPRRDEPVSVAAIPFEDGEPRPERGYESLVRPCRAIPLTATRIHGIDDRHVAGAPPFEAVLPALSAACGAFAPLVGFALGFDLSILNRLARRSRLPALAVPALDVAGLARALSPHWAGLTLEELAAQLGVPCDGRHTARGDAVIAGRIYVRLVPLLRAQGVHSLEAALRVQGRSLDAASVRLDGHFHGRPPFGH